jgi:homoserine O-acetyltransferase
MGVPMPADFATVEDRSFVISNFRLQDGTVMPQAKIIYETYGRLAADSRNAVLITHGYTSSHHAAGRNPANGSQPGWWDGLIRSGKPIDTDQLFVVSSNMLGSSFGSSNGASIDPRTGKPYGLDFPAITVRDIVASGPEHAKLVTRFARIPGAADGQARLRSRGRCRGRDVAS